MTKKPLHLHLHLHLPLAIGWSELLIKIAAAHGCLDATAQRGQQRVDALRQEADAMVEALKVQLTQAKGDMKAGIGDRARQVRSAYHVRGAKPMLPRHLADGALAV